MNKDIAVETNFKHWVDKNVSWLQTDTDEGLEED